MAGMTLVGGIVPVMNAQQLAAHEKEKETAFTPPPPVLTGLAGYVRRCWDTSYLARLVTADERLTRCLRQRNGEYDSRVLSDIRRFGGSEIFMMLTSNKCRAASAWLRDIYLTDDDRPWTIAPTKIPDLPPSAIPQVMAQATQDAYAMEAVIGQPLPPTPANIQMMVENAVARIKQDMTAEAKRRAENMANKMEDQLQQGGFYSAINAFLDDLVTFPYAVLKGPVVRRRKHLKWVPDAKSGYQLKVAEVMRYEWERVDPAMIYWAPDSANVEDGYLIERHHLTRSDLEAMKGTPGYDDNAITEVLQQFGVGGSRQWLITDATKADAEGKSILGVLSSPEQPIDALQFWGSVQGQMLLDWGMPPRKVPDPTAEYPCEVWLINNKVIKATINPDPLGRKPYYKTSYEQVPGGWMGNGVPDLIHDCQDMCNAAARALANNMAIASGPMVWVNLDRIARGEDVTQLYPWRIFQMTDSPMGNTTTPPVGFFQVDMFAQELMEIYNAFAQLADEYSNMPKYMTGNTGGVGRTASGMSMLINNATKAVKQVVYNIDMNVIEPMIQRLFYFNMKYGDDPDLKGDVNIVARGVNNLAVKEQLQVQRNQFLNTVVNSPVLAQNISPEALNNLLRETAKSLDMDTDEIVPPEDIVQQKMVGAMRQRQLQEAMAKVMQARAQATPPGAPPGGPGLPGGPPGMPPQGMPPQGMPPQGLPAGGPPPGMPPQGMPQVPAPAAISDIVAQAMGIAAKQMEGRGSGIRQNRQVLMDSRPIVDYFQPLRQ